jgi:hypothetical protein
MITSSTLGMTKYEAQHTWAIFIIHFNKHEKEQHRQLTAKAAGFHGAKRIAPINPPAATLPPPSKPAAHADTDQPATPSHFSTGCWTHGLSKKTQHTSKECEQKGEGNYNDATIKTGKKVSTRSILDYLASNVASPILPANRSEGSYTTY